MTEKMHSTGRTAALFVAVAVLLLAGFAARAQQAQQRAQPAGQEIRDNIAPHPAPEQPIPFSHKLHIAQGLRCQTCHTNPDPGSEMTFPATSTCMMCHTSVAKDRPAIMKLADFEKSNQAIPWVRVYQVTPGVTWTHRAHLQAGMRCTMCHGDDGRGTARAPDLTGRDVQDQTDGELFWKISTGNAHAGMPTFSFLPALQRWQLVLYLRKRARATPRLC